MLINLSQLLGSKAYECDIRINIRVSKQLLGGKGYECDIRINTRVSITDLQSQVPGNATVQ